MAARTVRLVHAETGEEIPQGRVLHPTDGTHAGAWRFEGVTKEPGGEHPHGAVHVSSMRRPIGRVHREMSAHVFGCRVVVDVKLYADAQRIKAVFHHFASATLALTIGGASAWAIGEILTRMVGG